MAGIAGVSIATVSRVINNPHLVQADTREHVLAVMQEVGYVSTRMPGGGVDNRSHTICFLFSVADYGFYEEALDGLESILQPRRYTALLCPISCDPARRAFQFETICARKPDGIIYALRDFHPENMEQINAARIPIVLARKYEQAPETYNCCYVNFAEGSYRMTQHLIALGRRKIMLLVEKVSFQFVASFCEGWRRAYEESGLPCSDAWIIHTQNTVEGGYAKAMELLQDKKAPEAFFCASGEMAFGALRAARDLNVSTPEELAVVGFTDPAIAQLSEPKLTTIDQSTRRLSIVAVRMLFDIIEESDSENAAPQEIVLQPKLFIRNSCGNSKPVNVLFE
ncbi:MAG: LacI family DNA-binding transcriptional regulator [Candidatus Pelethousia sp.]|nr:LacI family DNA-binding transcriptional regulator [Candidatus Pelethousia sp.]